MGIEKLDIKLLEEICNAFGPSGFESEAQRIVRDYGKKYADEILYDRTGSVIFRHGNKGPKIMLAGHCDEIGFIISRIEKKGFLKISNLGGWWDQTLLSQQIVIRPFSKPDNKVIGIIAAKPPHLLTPENRKKVVEMDSMFVDIGCNSENDVKDLGIQIGDPAVPYAFFRIIKRIWEEKKKNDEKKDEKEDEKKYREVNLAIAKAFDDRIGVFIVLEILRRISEGNIEHPNAIYGVSTTQEEVGLRGARTSAQFIKPDVGFALDVDISGDIPGIKGISQKMGEGVAISVFDGSMIPNLQLRKFVIELAEKNNIKWQPSFLKRGGTDAGVIHLAGIGAPSLFIGVPTRHIHSHQGMLDLDDVENTIRLIIEVIKSLNSETVTAFTAL